MASPHTSVRVRQAVKHHPASVDLELVKRLIVTSGGANLQKFLAKEFSCITKDLAGESPRLHSRRRR